MSKFQRQLHREEAAYSTVTNKVIKECAKASSKMRVGMDTGSFVMEINTRLYLFIQKQLESNIRGARWHGFVISMFKELSEQNLCDIINATTNNALSTIGSDRQYSTHVRSLGDHAEIIFNANHFSQNDEDAMSILAAKKNNFSTEHRYRSYKETAGAAGLFEEWTVDLKIQVGDFLMESLLASCGDYFRTEVKQVGIKKKKVIVASKAFYSKLKDRRELLSSIISNNEPMIVPPREWNPELTMGGYFSKKCEQPLLKIRDSEVRNAIAGSDNLNFYTDSLNKVQSVPYQVDTDILSVVNNMIDIQWDGSDGEEGSVLPRFITRENEQPKPKYFEECDAILKNKPDKMKVKDWAEQHGDLEKYIIQAREWRKQNSLRHRYNKEVICESVSFFRAVALLNDLSKEDEIFFPCNLDWRMRLYSIPTSISPQSTDWVKGCLKFGKEHEEELGFYGFYYMLVNLANLHSQDKAEFCTRARWAKKNWKMFLEIAADPINDHRWVEADEPFQFLQACFEAKRLQDWVDAGNKVSTFRSAHGYAMDASCSGTQVWACLTKDEDLARRTNVYPQKHFNDIYSDTAKVATEWMRHFTTHGTPINYTYQSDEQRIDALRSAMTWMAWDSAVDQCGNIKRFISKRPTMTLVYGSRCQPSHVSDDVLRPAKRQAMEMYIRGTDGYDNVYPFGLESSMKLPASTMAKALWYANTVVLKKGIEILDWVEWWGKTLAKNGVDPSWITPAGFKVTQYYHKSKRRQFTTRFHGKANYYNFGVSNGEVCVRKNKQGMAPNITHSLDAFFLHLVVNGSGSMPLWLIHDSFKTNYRNTHRLWRLLRRKMVELYRDISPNYLGELEEYWIGLLKEVMTERKFNNLMKKLPDSPSQGKLDLELIKKSKHCFC